VLVIPLNSLTTPTCFPFDINQSAAGIHIELNTAGGSAFEWPGSAWEKP
jgi:hypothetical protein